MNVVDSSGWLEYFANGPNAVFFAAAMMQLGRVVNLDVPIALLAAKLGSDLGLPLADSVILASARAHGAVVWTQDEDFKGIQGVKYTAKK